MLKIEPIVLLTELRTLANCVPDFQQFTATSAVHHSWLGRLHAVITRWDDAEARSLKFDQRLLGMSYSNSASNIVAVLHRAIEDLDLQLGNQRSQVFGPGAVYDFFKALRDLLSSATRRVFIVDPYMDGNIFDTYLTSVPHGVEVRLLTSNKGSSIAPAATKFTVQYKANLKARLSDAIHDRVIFLDGNSCWVLGQSIKDAAKSRVTYLAPLDSAIVPLKLAMHEQIWASAPEVQISLPDNQNR